MLLLLGRSHPSSSTPPQSVDHSGSGDVNYIRQEQAKRRSIYSSPATAPQSQDDDASLRRRLRTFTPEPAGLRKRVSDSEKMAHGRSCDGTSPSFSDESGMRDRNSLESAQRGRGVRERRKSSMSMLFPQSVAKVKPSSLMCFSIGDPLCLPSRHYLAQMATFFALPRPVFFFQPSQPSISPEPPRGETAGAEKSTTWCGSFCRFLTTVTAMKFHAASPLEDSL